MPKYKLRIEWQPTTVEIDTDDYAEENDNVDMTDQDAVHDLFIDLINDDPSAIANDWPEVETLHVSDVEKAEKND